MSIIWRAQLTLSLHLQGRLCRDIMSIISCAQLSLSLLTLGGPCEEQHEYHLSCVADAVVASTRGTLQRHHECHFLRITKPVVAHAWGLCRDIMSIICHAQPLDQLLHLWNGFLRNVVFIICIRQIHHIQLLVKKCSTDTRIGIGMKHQPGIGIGMNAWSGIGMVVSVEYQRRQGRISAIIA